MTASVTKIFEDVSDEWDCWRYRLRDGRLHNLAYQVASGNNTLHPPGYSNIWLHLGTRPRNWEDLYDIERGLRETMGADARLNACLFEGLEKKCQVKIGAKVDAFQLLNIDRIKLTPSFQRFAFIEQIKTLQIDLKAIPVRQAELQPKEI